MKSCTIIQTTEIENIGKYCLKRISEGYIIADAFIEKNEVVVIRSYARNRVLPGETEEKCIVCSEFYPHPESIGDWVSFSFNVKEVNKLKISEGEEYFNSLFTQSNSQREVWVVTTDNSMFARGPREFWSIQNICEELYESGLLSVNTG